MFYNARYYSPVVGRFVSADTIVPNFANPQSLNRYSYVYNNPLKYTDPSGHCVDNDRNTTRGDQFDCSIEELTALDWNVRGWWISELGKAAPGAEGWFNNIQWILHYFGGTPELNDLGGWASAADAGLIWSIQEGFREVWRDARAVTNYGAKWADFFRAAKNNPEDKVQMKHLWGTAEEAGTMFGRAYAEGVVGFPGGLEGELLKSVVIKEGDNYRSVLTRGTCNGCPFEDIYKGLDPTMGLMVYLGATLIDRGSRDAYYIQPEHYDWGYWFSRNWQNRGLYGIP